MLPEQAQEPRTPSRLRAWLPRLCGVAIAWFAIQAVTRPSPQLEDPSAPPSGLLQGIRHGALMPLALPRLLLGQEATIYAASNTGRNYKIGYTAGVNGCGALFFGITFWRLTRWKRGRTNQP